MLEVARATNLRYEHFWVAILRIDTFLLLSLKNLKNEKNPILTSELVVDRNRFKLSVSDEEDLRISAAGPTYQDSGYI